MNKSLTVTTATQVYKRMMAIWKESKIQLINAFRLRVKMNLS